MVEVREGGSRAPVSGHTRWIVGEVISSLRGRRDLVGLEGEGEVYAVRRCWCRLSLDDRGGCESVGAMKMRCRARAGVMWDKERHFEALILELSKGRIRVVL